MADHLGRLTWRQRTTAELPAFRSDGRDGRNTSRRRCAGRPFGYFVCRGLITPGLLALSTLAFGFYATCKLASGVVGVLLRVAPSHCCGWCSTIANPLNAALAMCGLAGGDCLVGSLSGVHRLPEVAPAGGRALLNSRLGMGLVWRVFGRGAGLRVGDTVGPRFVVVHSFRARRGRASAYANGTRVVVCGVALLHYALLSLGFLLGLGFLQSTYQDHRLGQRLRCRYRFWFAQHRQQSRIRPDPACRAPINSDMRSISAVCPARSSTLSFERRSTDSPCADTIVPHLQFVSETVAKWT